ncbi:MAG: CoA-transferase [Hydrogenophaga sp. SCN 70-13]|uniref:CoA transferase n=2 Tax=Comamonadaceae TaxID=80864 RepID=A0A372EK16_9BURK|nr:MULTISPECIES: CaiB/BaiF CoA-transferase family protein [Hydrogenophaga]MBN9410298.1 CoA transferase [Burkholderiales bacterium]NCT97938.1 CoA transferase [Comamonadaceae bacterium]ODT34758.1 MAG: CoA-transferase [Hydrogenophaga sp. SCN 70-13]MBN9371877.1 CoA transferase [Hydrogenophaga sp.]MBX3609581.1 CoA transferase [Hydrogenophaga sp.]
MNPPIASQGSPLKGIRIVEFEGIGPGPLAGLFLAQLGADVTVVARPGPGALPKDMTPREDGLLSRGKRRVVLNLKQENDRDRALEIVAASDGLIEGNRPGVMERLGLGPGVCGRLNPRLVYGRMTGWGQDGPLAQAAGHDMNYVALTGLMALTERPGHPPILPPTVLGDAAGALGFSLGMVSGLLAARTSGQGCVVDGAIVDVLAMLSPLVQLVSAAGGFDAGVPSVFHDSPFYDRYLCADGRYVTVGAIEPPFYALLLERLGLSDVVLSEQMDRSAWPALKARMAALFASRPSAHWTQLLEGTDACYAPVLNMAEAARHPHNVARGLYHVTPAGDVETVRGLRFAALADRATRA